MRRRRHRSVEVAACAVSLLSLCLPPVPTRAQATATTVIHAVFSETHDRIRPNYIPGVVLTRDFTVTLSGRNDVREEVKQTSGRFERQFDTTLALGDGGATNKITWKVVGTKQLQRTVNFPQHVMVMTISVLPNNACSLDVQYRLKPGFRFARVRAPNGMWALISLPRVLSVSCTIS